MCRCLAVTITVNDTTYYERDTLIAAFVLGLILFIIGIIRLLRCKKGAFLKYRDSKYCDAPLNSADTDEFDEYIEADEQIKLKDEQIFNELIKNEQIDEEINRPENGSNVALLTELTAEREQLDAELLDLYEKWEALQS